MLKIRLQITGRRNDRHFRIIVAEHTIGPKSGKYVEKIGFINPRTKEQYIDVERAKYWLSVGAKPTDRVYNMLVDAGVFEGPKKNVLPRKKPIKKEGEEGDTEAAENADTSSSTENENVSENSENTESETDSPESTDSENG